MSRQIFISYRRADSEGSAGRLYDRLSSQFGKKNIFRDVDAIEGGADFAKKIEQALRDCDVLLALIGLEWLTVKDEKGNLRLKDPKDYVRLEIATALASGKQVIPVLIKGASMPKESDLPKSLKRLAKRNAIPLSSAQFPADVDRLINAIERALDEAERERSIPPPVLPSAIPSLHQLPQPPTDFTGHEELIAQFLADFKQGQGAIITGLAGTGKTPLGLVVAHRVAKDYPDGQIFIDLKGNSLPLSAMDVMRHVIRSFVPEEDLRTLDEVGMTNVYRNILHGRRALLFFDNAHSAKQIAPLRPPETCAMLVTSSWNFSIQGLHTRSLDAKGGMLSKRRITLLLLTLVIVFTVVAIIRFPQVPILLFQRFQTLFTVDTHIMNEKTAWEDPIYVMNVNATRDIAIAISPKGRHQVSCSRWSVQPKVVKILEEDGCNLAFNAITYQDTTVTVNVTIDGTNRKKTFYFRPKR